MADVDSSTTELTDFTGFGVSKETLRGLASMGFEAPTPVQARAIPCLLEGRDVIAQALTGTGKTAAYGVPIAERIDPKQHVPQAVVMTPTRELAIQVTDQLCKIGHYRGLEVLPIYGGQPIGRQLHMLHRGVNAIVATPGRLLDHMRRGSVDLSNVRTLVLDEADQMLEMGFIEDVQYVLEHLPEERVTALFSATMPRPIVELARRYLRDPEMIRLSKPQGLTVPEIDQSFYIVPFARKLDALSRVLDVRQPERAIVFCATRRMVDELVEGLAARGYVAEALHGDISQAVRERVLRAFRSGKTEVLVATDVAARGLDIPEVSLVINFDIPPDPEYYVHRIGRTGRFGRRGEAITFVNPHEMRVLRIIERVTGARIRREEVPTIAEAEEREAEMLGERLLAALTKGNWGRYRPIVEELLDDHDPVDLAAAALGLLASAPRATRSTARTPTATIDGPVVRERPEPDGWDRDRRSARAPRQPGPAPGRAGPDPERTERRAAERAERRGADGGPGTGPRVRKAPRAGDAPPPKGGTGKKSRRFVSTGGPRRGRTAGGPPRGGPRPKRRG